MVRAAKALWHSAVVVTDEAGAMQDPPVADKEKAEDDEVGLSVGDDVGDVLGELEGDVVGLSVGAVGGGVGIFVGETVGDDVGDVLGELEGEVVGLFVGEDVGVFVGIRRLVLRDAVCAMPMVDLYTGLIPIGTGRLQMQL